MKKLLYISAYLIFASSTALADPSITSYSGTMGHGQSITISGSDFGTKSTAVPKLWDNFESGTVGNPVAGTSPVVGSAWSDYYSDTNRASFDNAVIKTNSTKSSRHQFGGNNYNVSLLFNGNQPEYYFTYYWYFTHTGSWPRNTKPWFMFGSSADEPHAYSGYGEEPGDGGLRDTIMDGANDYSVSGWGSTSLSDVENKWVRFEVYLKQSSAGVSDGAYEMYTYIDGQTIIHDIDEPPVTTRASLSRYYTQLMLGTYCSDNFTTANVYMDDVYIDNTLSRVEVCDAATWAARQHCDIQIPTEWSASSVTAVVNRGSFGATDNAYLYVVDSAGAVNADGYAITFGDTGVDNVPSQFTFTDQTGVALGSTNNSDNVTVAGIDNTTTLTLTGDASCKYSTNGADWATGDNTVAVGDNVALQNAASGSYSTAVTCTLNVGGVTDPWSRITLAATAAEVPQTFRGGNMGSRR